MKNLFSLIILSATLSNYIVSGQTLLINEFEARNSKTIADNKGEYDDWIEIVNVTNKSIDLNGYYITDDLTKKSKCKLTAMSGELIIPAKGYIIFWADDNLLQGASHLNFKLTGSNGFIGLFADDLTTIDSITYPSQQIDISFGRDIINQSAWNFYSTPTPGKSNNTVAYKGVLSKPIFSKISSNFTSNIQISISSTNTADTIVYTVDNSDPNGNSSIYDSPVDIYKTQVLRGVSRKYGYLQSEIESQIYFNNVDYSLPILALITDSTNLFGSQGIYTNYGQSGDAWERFCQMKFLEKNGNLLTEANLGIRIQGSSSVFMDKKSFRLFFRDAYGNGKLNYPIFGAQNITSFDKLVLKSGYDDDLTMDIGTLLRDALSVELWKRVGGIPQLSSWTILYLNNRYWGIYNIRESIEESYIKAHTGFTDFDLVRFHNDSAELKYGNMTEWNSLFNFIKTTNFALPENYAKAKTMIDMENFITLMAFVQCTDYYSWPWGISMFRERMPSGKWKFSIWDTDRAYSNIDWNGFDEARNHTETYYWGNIFAKQLMANNEFNDSLANKIEQFENTTFKAENAISILDSIYNIVKPEISGEITRWAPSNISWESNVEFIRDFFRKRPKVLKTQLPDILPVNSLTFLPLTVNLVPNPFENNLTIEFHLIEKEFINVSVISTNGEIIKSIVNTSLPAGNYTYHWDCDNSIHSGIYLIKFTTSNQTFYKKVIKK